LTILQTITEMDDNKGKTPVVPANAGTTMFRIWMSRIFVKLNRSRGPGLSALTAFGS